jgi:hypothetical protein
VLGGGEGGAGGGDVIDALTPDGTVSDGDATSGIDLGGLLEGLAGAAQAGQAGPLAGWATCSAD